MINYEFLTRYMKKRSQQSMPAFFNSIKKAYILRSLFLCLFIFLPDIKKNKRVAFVVGPHAVKQISPSDRSNLCIIGGPIEYFLARKCGAGFINTSLLYVALTFTLFTFFKSKKITEKILDNILCRVNAVSGGSAMVIHHSDALPYGRLLNDFFKKNNFPTVCLQHGYFDESIFEMDGFYSDFNVAIDAKQLLILKNAIGDNGRFAIANHLSVSHKVFCPTRKRKHCILLGEGWKSHNVQVHNNYINFLIQVRNKLAKSNNLIRYRPHPSEKFDLVLLLKMLPITLNGRGEGINCQDTYIGASSSLLAEAARLGATVISVKGLVPTHSIESASIKYIEQEDLLVNFPAMADVPLTRCMGHNSESISLEKLVSFVQKNKS